MGMGMGMGTGPCIEFSFPVNSSSTANQPSQHPVGIKIEKKPRKCNRVGERKEKKRRWLRNSAMCVCVGEGRGRG
jgi:hypothetical protein